MPARVSLVRATDLGIYGLVLGFLVTVVLLTAWRTDALDVCGRSVADPLTPFAQFAGVVASAFNTAVMPLVLRGATFDPERDLEAMESIAQTRAFIGSEIVRATALLRGVNYQPE